ncbi:MAG: GNAT family N-acetyltransferase, partial [Phycisphaerae bacterium]
VHPVKREPLGYGELNPMRRRDRWWLGHILVQPALRGQGVGRLLVERLVDHAYTRLGATRVILVVSPDNTRALRCYQSVGFSVVGEERHAIANRGGSVRLARLELDAAARWTQRLPTLPPAAAGGATARSKPRAATIT